MHRCLLVEQEAKKFFRQVERSFSPPRLIKEWHRGFPDAILPVFTGLHFSFFPGEHRPYPMGVKNLRKLFRVSEITS